MTKDKKSFIPMCEIERFENNGVLYQRLSGDMFWYAVYNGQIIDRDRYRDDLKERVNKVLEKI